MDQPTRKQPVWLPFAVVGGAVVAVMILWTVLSSPANRPATVDTPRETFTLTGKITVPARVESFMPGDGCIGDRGYTDIQPGAGVTVYNSSGTVLATGTLGEGRKDGLRCAYSLTVTNVPGGAGIYQVEVKARGKVQFDESTLRSTGASLTLG